MDNTVESAVERFLCYYPERAFTEADIAEGVYGVWGILGPNLEYFRRRAAVLESVKEALQRLLNEGKVSVKDVKKKRGIETYYTIS
jgi:hypothetical protein